MQTILNWKLISEELPIKNKRVLCFSSKYSKDSLMRLRIINGQFVKMCEDIDAWVYINEPNLKRKK